MSADDAKRVFQDFYTDMSLIKVQHPTRRGLGCRHMA